MPKGETSPAGPGPAGKSDVRPGCGKEQCYEFVIFVLQFCYVYDE